MTNDTNFRMMVRDRVVRIESKLSRHIADQEIRNKRVDSLCDRVETFLDEWATFKQEWDREGLVDEEDSSPYSGDVATMPRGDAEQRPSSSERRRSSDVTAYAAPAVQTGVDA
jgi:hypothetical protein